MGSLHSSHDALAQSPVVCTEYEYGCDSYTYIVMPDIVGMRVLPPGQAEQHVQCIHVYAYRLPVCMTCIPTRH